MPAFDPASIVMGLLQYGAAKQSPYDAAKASTYAMQEMYNNLGDYTNISNAVNPPLNVPFRLSKGGQTVWQPAIQGNIFSRSSAFKSGNPDQFLADQIARATQGAQTQLPQQRQSTFSLQSLFGGGQ